MHRSRSILLAMAVAVALTSALIGASLARYFDRTGAAPEAEPAATGRPAPPPAQAFAFGTIASKTPDSFVLRTAQGTIVVEVDDSSPLYREATMLRDGERVAVVGRADGAGRIEASRVFVEALPTPIRADPADEEGRSDGGR